MAVVSQIPPEAVPVLAGDRLSPMWRRFLESLWRRSGGFEDQSAGVAQETADQALADAAAAQVTADAANAAAATAQVTADGAVTDAAGAQADATTALSDAAAAAAAAGTALIDAAQASSDAAAAQADADALETALQGAQSANRVYAGPASGAAAAPTFRALVVADLPTPPTFSAHRNGAAQSIASGSFVKVQCTTTEWNVGGDYDGTTNHRFTPSEPGKYQLDAVANVGVSAPCIVILSIFKNGVEYKRGGQLYASIATNVSATISTLVEANGSTDYFELFVFQNCGAAVGLDGTDALSWFQGALAAR
jgi:hypothetical protein